MIGSGGSKYVLKRKVDGIREGGGGGGEGSQGEGRIRRRWGRRRKMRKPGVVGDKDEEKDFGRGSYRT